LNEHKNTLIVGDNGAGKTTCLEAIMFALYGKPLRNINKPKLVNSITQKHLMVELEFDIAKKEYLIRRGMKPDIFEIFCDGVLLNQDSKAKDYQKVLETQILKINYKSAGQIIMLSMANYTPFMKLESQKRREVIEDLLDIQIFSVMNTLLKDKINENKQLIQDTEYEIKLVTNNIALHKKHVAELNQNTKELVDERRKKIEEYNEQIAQSSALIVEYQKEIQGCQAAFGETDVKAQLANLEGILKKAEVQKAKIHKELAFYQEHTSCPTCTQPLDHEFKCGTIQAKNELLEKIESGLPRVQKKLADTIEIAKKMDALNDAINFINRKISDQNITITTCNKFIETLTKEMKELETRISRVKADNSTLLALNGDLAKHEANKAVLSEDKEVLSIAHQLLKDSGIKTRIIKQYIPVMNKLINSYLAKMDFFVQFELDETFKETIKSRFRDEFSYDSFSEGEKLRIDLALMFSWRAVAKMRNSASTNLLFMDEILDSSLDTSGVDEFLKIIKNLTSDTNLFIISHKGDQLVDKFDHVIKFEKHRNFSRMAA
jgi:DNA repair exonuclease SbcCD ATPase subunit